MTALRVEGSVQNPRSFTFADLAELPGQIDDIGTLIPGRQGGGVQLRAVLEAAGFAARATHLTLQATDGKFSASVPLAEIIDRGIIVYRQGESPLPVAQGGPLRFYIADVASCTLADVDACANVKFLGRIQVGMAPGVDTRPTTVQAHEALHAREHQEKLH